MRATDGKQIAEKWLKAFAGDVPRDKLDKHVYDYGNLLWHIFSWELVECLSEDEARAAFDALDYKEALCFRSGYSADELILTESICNVPKTYSHELDSIADVYVTAPDFSWTYVHTHEESCGPYFLKINEKGNKQS
ncbi:MAG: DUF4275 family protein [Ruminococcaceae bacterium]|nr:DUF4275 family protein [Oscillospiraceae bacterium]